MVQQSNIEVRSVSVVLVASTLIDPESVRPEVLTRGDVVPNEWGVVNSATTELAALTEYDNDISISVDGTRCVLLEGVAGPFRAKYEVHSLARRYANATRLVQYSAIGINWSLDVLELNPDAWLRGKITGHDTEFADFQTAQVRLVKLAGDYNFNVTIVNENTGLLLDCNYHYPVVGNPPQLIAAILDDIERLQAHLLGDVVARL